MKYSNRQKTIAMYLERKKFIFASYNVSQGHVQDAVRFARKYGKETKLWEDNVEFFPLL